MSVAFFIFAVAVALTFMALRFKAHVVGFVGGLAWVFLAFFVQRIGLGSAVTTGGPIDTGIFVILIGAGILLALFSAGSLFSKNGDSFRDKAFGSNSQKVVNYTAGEWRTRKNNPNTMDSRAFDYRSLVHAKLNQPKKRRL
jgi:hypothetical protein